MIPYPFTSRWLQVYITVPSREDVVPAADGAEIRPAVVRVVATRGGP
jgi:hypothetical protein